jgi:hypothetical protein
MASNRPIRRISKWDMCRLFNEGKYFERVLSGELTARIENERPSTIVSATIPPGSISQEVFYYEGTNLVAVVQNFITPSGQIAGSGKPDPKRMVINNIAYRRRKATDPVRSRLSNREINRILGKSGWDARFTYSRGWWDMLKNVWYNTILGSDDW